MSSTPLHGRGASDNPPNRFVPITLSRDEWRDPEDPLPHTRLLRDSSRSILTYNDSPDVGFDVGINPYRGCEHGCAYCYARPYHEYLGFSAGLDFETNILVKERAPELPQEALESPKWQPQVIGMSGVTDPYQPIERRLGITRACLEVLARYRNPVSVITKNYLVTRDIDLLAELARYRAAAVAISVTTVENSRQRTMEPRTSTPERRLAAIARLAEAGIPVGVFVAPVIPGLTDHEIPAILDAAARAGAGFAGYIMLRLPHGVKELFETWLEQHTPDRKDKVLNRVRAMRGGRLNDPRFATRGRGEGPFAQQIRRLFAVSCARSGLARRSPRLSARSFRPGGGNQLGLFESTSA
jgi:DNA repair photolyase